MWQIGSRWSYALIDDIIKDMKDIHANIRFQAVVVCTRAAEFADSLEGILLEIFYHPFSLVSYWFF